MLPHLDAAFSFARFLTRDATQAEDVVQDAYLRAYRSFTAWRGDGAKAWLFAIVRSSWQDSLRRQNRGWTTADEADDIADDADTPEQALLRSANSQAVRNAIEALADPFREAIVLRELEGLSYREIAEVTAAPMGTVMSRLGRARQLLIAALGPEALS
jgi:RNA polymerase sigma-70 factor (ECF subfamily)